MAKVLHQVCQVANALRGLGLGKGDAVGLYTPMTPRSCHRPPRDYQDSSGSSCSSSVGRRSHRYRHPPGGCTGERAAFTADGSLRSGKAVEMLHTEEAARHCLLRGVCRHATVQVDRPVDVLAWRCR